MGGGKLRSGSCELAELCGVPDSLSDLLQEVVDMLVGLGLHPGFRFDSIRDLNGRIQANVFVETPTAVQISFDQDEFLRCDPGETWN